MKANLILVFICLFQGSTTPSSIVPIFLEEYNIYIYPDKGTNELYSIKASDSSVVNIKLLSLKGAMKVEVFNSAGKMKEKGAYINSLDLLKKYGSRKGYSRLHNQSYSEIIVSQYYQPLRDGVWIFYDNNTITTKIYARGIEQIK